MNRSHHDQINTPPPAECSFTRENLEAFALGALDSLDRGMVEQHLRWCDRCRPEAVRFEKVTAALPAASPITPGSTAAMWAAIRARLDEPEPAATAIEAPFVRPTPLLQEKNRWSQMAYPAIVAPLVIALIVMGAWVNSLRDQVDDTSAELANQALLNSTLSDGGQVELYSVEQSCPECQGTGQIGVSSSNSMGMLVGWDFDPTVDHQVWGIEHNGDRQKFCDLKIKSNGAVMQMFIFPVSPSEFTDLYITNEFGELIYISHILVDGGATPPATTAPSVT